MRAELGGVPETLLWTLYHRALEARRPDGVLDDPLAVELVDRIDHPFAERFGEGGGGVMAQWQALRVRRALPLRRGRGAAGGFALPAATRLPGLRGLLPAVFRADFA